MDVPAELKADCHSERGDYIACLLLDQIHREGKRQVSLRRSIPLPVIDDGGDERTSSFEDAMARLKSLVGLDPSPGEGTVRGKTEARIEGRVFRLEVEFIEAGEDSSCQITAVPLE
jgi:hypothetical protein